MRSAKYFLYSNLDSTLLSVMSHKISIPKLKSYLDTIDSLFEVSEPIFLKFIQLSEEQDSDALVALVDQISSQSITDQVFWALLMHPDQTVKNRLIFSLSHLPLSASQLFILCQYGLTFDCFYSLGELLYQDNRINSITYELFLRFFKNSRFGRHYEMFIRSFLNRDGEILLRSAGSDQKAFTTGLRSLPCGFSAGKSFWVYQNSRKQAKKVCFRLFL